MYYGFFLYQTYIGLIEPGVSFIYDLAVRYDNFYVFSFCVYFLFLSFIFYGIKKNSPNYLISISLLVIMHIYYNSYNQLRQMIAVSIIFCFAHFLVTNKKTDRIKYILVILLALLFHNSALFLFVLFFIPKEKFSPKVVIPLFLMTIIYILFLHLKIKWGALKFNLRILWRKIWIKRNITFLESIRKKGYCNLFQLLFKC